jgi:uncharacterized membrane protein
MRPARKQGFHPRSEGSIDRLQALSDGFFAVAMTLLVLDLSSGEGTSQPVSGVLHGTLPHLLLYFDSMLVLGALWFGHRNAFEFVRRTDHPHTWLTLAMLAFVALVPWTTALVAQHIHEPLAITVYTANLAIVTALDAAAWWYATGRPQLATGMTPRLVRVSRLLGCVPVAGFVLATGLTWLSTWAALAVVVALPLLPVTGVSYRVQHRLSRAGGEDPA